MTILSKRENLGTFEVNERFAIEHDCNKTVLAIYLKSRLTDGISVPSPEEDPELWACIGRIWAYVLDHSQNKKYLLDKEVTLKDYSSAEVLLQILNAMSYFATSDSDNAKDSFINCAGKIASIAMYFGTK